MPLTSSIYLVFLSLKMQRRLRQTEVCQKFFYFLWKETTHKPIQAAAAKTLFPSVYVISKTIRKTCFNECLLFHMNWKTLPFINVYRYSVSFLTAILLLSLKSVFWEKTVFYALFPQQQHQGSKISWLCFLNFHNFTFLTVSDVPDVL